MELTFLPGEKTTRRTYKHFTINSTGPADTAATKKLEFFYVGKRVSNIDNLITSFESGYAAESVIHAKSMLKRLIGNNNPVAVPDVIIVEAAAGEDALRELQQFLVLHDNLAVVPFVLEITGLPEEDIARFKKFGFIDDMMCLGDHPHHTLTKKIRFLQKIKHNIFDEAGSRAVETSLQEISHKTAYIKRGFDILISAGLLLVLSPVLLLVAIAIRVESKGSIFYIAKRAGRGYRIFDFYKFRTMGMGADQKMKEFSHLNQYNAGDGKPMFFKIDNDPRITRVGNFLRKTSLDELPQLLNVLLGDMSLVGNRPLPLYEAASLTTDEWAKRFMAPAGMTGLWQIKKRGKKEMSIEERITLDIDYANRYSFLYDLWIMANTPSALIQKTNA